MTTARYAARGRWYKGNTHIHTRASDGGKTPAELARLYADAGYDFLYRTDHWVPSNTAAEPDAYPLLWLDGVELNGADREGSNFHIVALGRFTGIRREMGFADALESVRAQGGLLLLAHPAWMGNSFDDAFRHGFHGVEVYNHVCRWLNGKDDGGVYWNAMLERSPATLGFASDDAHIVREHPGWNGGWIMVNAPECSRAAIDAAVRAGHFYSTCGPEFHDIDVGGGGVRIRTSPVRFVRLVGPKWLGERIGSFDGPLLTEATIELPPDWAYCYLELEDEHGRRAWSNTF